MVPDACRRWSDATKDHLPSACSKIHVEQSNMVVSGPPLRLNASAACDQTTPLVRASVSVRAGGKRVDRGDVPPLGEGINADKKFGPCQKVGGRWKVDRG